MPPYLKSEYEAHDGDSNQQASQMDGEAMDSLVSNGMEVLEYRFSKQEVLIRELFDMQHKSLKSTMTGLLSDFGHDTQEELGSIRSMLSDQMLKSPRWSGRSEDDLGKVEMGHIKSEKSEVTLGAEEIIEMSSVPLGSYGPNSVDVATELSNASKQDSGERFSLLSVEDEINYDILTDGHRDDCCARCLLSMREAFPREPRDRLSLRVTQVLNLASSMRETSLNNEAQNSLPTEWWSIERIVRSSWFTGGCSLLIFLNAIYMGISTDYAMERQCQRFTSAKVVRNPFASLMAGSTEMLDLIFAILFALEIILRIWGYGCLFFCGSEWAWNLFDATIVSVSLAQVCLAPFFDTDQLKVVRIIRLIRVISALRKVPCLRKLEHMLLAVFNTLPALAPAVLLLILMMYVFVLFFMQGLVDYLITADPRDADSGVDDLVSAFGTVTDALETLFMSVVGGRNWDGLLVAMRRVGPLYEVTFPVYVGFVTFAVLNILTGIFVDAAQQFSSMDRELAVELQVDKEKEYVKGLMNLFVEADVDKSGTLTWDEFMEHFESTEVRAYLKGMDLNVTSAKKIFNLIDGDNTGEIGIQAFLETCLQLRGTAQVVDIVIMRSDMENMIEQKMNSMLEKVANLKMLTTKAFKDINRQTQGMLGTGVNKLSTSSRSSVKVGQDSASSINVGRDSRSSVRGPVRSSTKANRVSGSLQANLSDGVTPYAMLSGGSAGSLGPVDLGSYGAFKDDGTGITGMRNVLLQEHNNDL